MHGRSQQPESSSTLTKHPCPKDDLQQDILVQHPLSPSHKAESQGSASASVYEHLRGPHSRDWICPRTLDLVLS